MGFTQKGITKRSVVAPWPDLPPLPAALRSPEAEGFERALTAMWTDVRAQLDRLAAGQSFVSGMVMQWTRPIAEIPTGWQICDGTNGTLDLRNCFVKCVGPDEDPGARGGAERHTPVGTVAAPTFTGTAGTVNAASAGAPSGTFVGTADLETSEDTAGTPTGTNAAPALTMASYTPAGTVSAPTFTGNAVAASTTSATPDLVAPDTTGTGVSPVITATGSVSAPTFTGTAHTLTGTVAAPVFTGDEMDVHKHTYTPEGTIEGDEMAPHGHTYTPAGTNSAPEFIGTEASFEPPHYKLAYIQKL